MVGPTQRRAGRAAVISAALAPHALRRAVSGSSSAPPPIATSCAPRPDDAWSRKISQWQQRERDIDAEVELQHAGVGGGLGRRRRGRRSRGPRGAAREVRGVPRRAAPRAGARGRGVDPERRPEPLHPRRSDRSLGDARRDLPPRRRRLRRPRAAHVQPAPRSRLRRERGLPRHRLPAFGRPAPHGDVLVRARRRSLGDRSDRRDDLRHASHVRAARLGADQGLQREARLRRRAPQPAELHAAAR